MESTEKDKLILYINGGSQPTQFLSHFLYEHFTVIITPKSRISLQQIPDIKYPDGNIVQYCTTVDTFIPTCTHLYDLLTAIKANNSQLKHNNDNWMLSVKTDINIWHMPSFKMLYQWKGNDWIKDHNFCINVAQLWATRGHWVRCRMSIEHKSIVTLPCKNNVITIE